MQGHKKVLTFGLGDGHLIKKLEQYYSFNDCDSISCLLNSIKYRNTTHYNDQTITSGNSTMKHTCTSYTSAIGQCSYICVEQTENN